ncbi:MAG: hypothetical protein KJN92_07100, partial [Gemmatimonadetes bacterium]|nr:hypothetical protein [Gemmatimonadota bacterium]
MTRLKSPYLAAFFCYTLVGFFGPACAQEPQEPPTVEEIQAAESAPLFSSQEVLQITLQADFHTIRREDRSDKDSEERPAVMSWTNPDGSVETQDVQVQTRGIFRLSKRNCDFPPLRLNVKKGQVEGTLFDGQDKLKMVAPCKLGQDYWQQYVIAEYLVYRMFNVLAEESFRVRPIQVTFTDTSGEDDEFTRIGFLLEDNAALATRKGGWKVDWDTQYQFDPRLLEKHQAILVDVFQFMIGNTDWSGVQMHNVELIHSPPTTYHTVPYDFDFSGIIDTRYANPDESLGLRSVRERRFRGICPEDVFRSGEDYEAVFEEFRQKKEELYDLWRNQEGLDERRLERTLDYLDDFYEILD